MTTSIDEQPEYPPWQPVNELEVLAVNLDGEPYSGDDYCCTVIGHVVHDQEGYSIIEVCTGVGPVADMELAQLILKGLKEQAGA